MVASTFSGGCRWDSNGQRIQRKWRVVLTLDVPNIHVQCYIDNILFVGDEASVALARDMFLERCRRILVHDGRYSGVRQVVSYRGMSFDFASKKVCLADSSVGKLTSRVTVAEEHGQIRVRFCER